MTYFGTEIVMNRLINIILNFIITLVLILITNIGESANIERCSEITKKCIIKLDKGSIGNKVKILNERAHVVGEGKIIHKKGPFGIIYVTKIRQNIRKGYPVIVDIHNEYSNAHWAASFSDINNKQNQK